MTEKLRLDFTCDQWLETELRAFKKKTRLESWKDTVQEYIKMQQVEIETLKAEKAAPPPSVVAQTEPPNSPIAAAQPQEPRQEYQQKVRYMDTPPENPERVIELSHMTVSLQNGVWTFSRKQQEALAFAEHLLAIKNEKTRELMVIKEQGQRAIERAKTEGRQARARIQREVAESERNRPRTGSRGGGHYPLDDNSEHGGPVDEYIR